METKMSLLHKMFELQGKLVENYIQIENLPKPPIDIQSRQGQKIIRDFVYRTIGELAEAFGTMLVIFGGMNENEDRAKVKQDLIDYNEELADVIHFFIETLIFSGITADGIDVWLLKKKQEENNQIYTAYKERNPLHTLHIHARFLNECDECSFEQTKGPQNFVFPSVESHYVGGSIISRDLISKHSEFLWSITYLLNRAINTLKNKDWNQVLRISNSMDYHESMMDALIMIIRYLEFTGHTPLTIYTIYERKNQINLNRIKDGY